MRLQPGSFHVVVTVCSTTSALALLIRMDAQQDRASHISAETHVTILAIAKIVVTSAYSRRPGNMER